MPATPVQMSAIAAVTAALLSGAACGRPAAEDGTARILLSREGSGMIHRAGPRMRPPASIPRPPEGAARSGVPLDVVSALRVRVEGIELRRVGGSADREEAWVRVESPGRTALDLMNLPVGGGVELARGAVPAGEYDRLRLRLSEPSVVLNRAVRTPDGARLSPGEHPILLPAPDPLGLRVRLRGYRVVAGEPRRLVLEFLERPSASTLTVTPAGLLMRPVLTPGRLVRL